MNEKELRSLYRTEPYFPVMNEKNKTGMKTAGGIGSGAMLGAIIAGPLGAIVGGILGALIGYAAE